jgi:predicted acetyltransferase
MLQTASSLANLSPSDVVVRATEASELRTLENLYQLYAYDFSEMIELELDASGRFSPKEFGAYFLDDWRHPFLIFARGQLAGFALVHQKSRLSGDLGVADMAEFFVVRRYRRQGVGSSAAHELFRKFAGRWEVRQTPNNQAATAFWRRVIGQFTGRAFHEAEVSNEHWRGPVQSFDSSQTPG